MLKVMFAVTRRAGDKRCLACPNQGGNHFDTIDEAKAWLQALLKNNLVSTLRQSFGDTELLRVDPIICYSHGDAIQVFLDEYPLMNEAELCGFVDWINHHVNEADRGWSGQAGTVFEIFKYIQDHNLPKHEWLWDTILETIKNDRTA